MTLTARGREALALGLLAALPALAYSRGLLEGRLLGPGDGAFLHYPLRAAVWSAYRHLEIPSWNPWIFSGTPLLAAYRPGALHPLMILLAGLPAFAAFQALVLLSLAAAGVLAFLYVRRLGAGVVGAYLSGLSFALGPYLVGHLGDTATLVAAPALPLILLAAEAYLHRPTAGRTAALAAALALLLLAGSPEAARAGGALLAGRIVVAALGPRDRPPLGRTALALLAGALLAAPQLLPTLLLAPEAGRQVTGLTASGDRFVPGVTGLILRYVSHTPAPSLALAALPLVLTETPVRVLGVALGLCLGLQWGRGPLSAPGALALVFDFTLAVLAGLSLSAQWEVRREAVGRHLRAYFLLSCLASAAALSISAAALGPLPETLAGAVGVLALSLILYFSLAASPDPLKAGLWLLPLTVSFLLQPEGREQLAQAPRREVLERPTATREALDRAMGPRRDERVLTLTRRWPREEAFDLAFADLAILLERRSANGYDPMVPLRSRLAFQGMSVGGTLPGAFFRTDPAGLERLAIRWVQIPASALTTAPDATGLGDTLDVPLEAGRPRYLPLPFVTATEVRIASLMSDAVSVPQAQPVARILVHLASGRQLELQLRAGVDTGEWAYDRPDVRTLVAHERPPILESWEEGGAFLGHRYLGTLSLPGRYFVDGLRIERLPGPGRLTLSRLAVRDGTTGRASPVSLAAGYVSDTTRVRETAATPAARLFLVPGTPGRAHVVASVQRLPGAEAVRAALLSAGGGAASQQAIAEAADVAGVALPPGSRASRAALTRTSPERLEARAEGPGLLVLAEGWDPGWSAWVDGRPARVLRVNAIQMGIVLTGGFHRVVLRHHARGFAAGVALAATGALALALAGRHQGRTSRSS